MIKARPSFSTRGGVEQQIALLAERHLQVHAHFGREQAVGERQRRGVGRAM